LRYLPLVNLWDQRSLIFHFSLLNLKIRYQGTFLGFLWNALEPLFMFILLYVVFTNIGPTKENFAIYLITGVLLYHTFVQGTISGLNSIRSNQGILQSLNVKKEIFPVVATGSTLILLLIELIVFFGLMPIFNFTPTWHIIFLAPLFILFILLILGISYILSILSIYVKDIQPIWGVFSYSLLFASPIFWYVEEGGILLEIQKINPLGQLIELGHKIVFGQIPPISEWLYPSLFIFGILMAGYAIFQKYEMRVTERL